MEVANKNMGSKSKSLEYLKSNKSVRQNKHEEKEFKKLIASVVLINTTIPLSNENNYSVCITCIEKEKNTIYDNIMNKEFDNEPDATNYYSNLKEFINSTSEEKLYEIINENIKEQ